MGGRREMALFFKKTVLFLREDVRWSDKHKRDLIEGKKLMKLAEFKEKYIGDRAFYKRYLYLALP